MKTRLLLTLTALLTLARVVCGQGTAFTYNGRLNDNGAPANGNYDLRFTLYDAEVGMNGVAGPLLVTPVAVANGLFSVRVDFGARVFSGPARWLEISVRPVGVGDFTSLAPRQEVTSSPYAIRAASAGTAADVSAGTVVKSLNALQDDVTLAAGANVTITPNGNTLTLAAAGAGGSGIWSVNGNNAYYNAGNVGIGTTTPVAQLQAETGEVKPAVYGHATGAGTGVQGESSTGIGVYASSSSGNGVYATSATASGVEGHSGTGIGVYASSIGGRGVYATSVSGTGVESRSTSGFGVFGASASASGVEGHSGSGFGVYGKSDSGEAGHFDGDVFVGGYLSLEANRTYVHGFDGLGFHWFTYGTDADRMLGLHRNGPNSYDFTVNGATYTKTLTITGGSDVAEPFQMSSGELPKGAVVVIDEENPGRLKLSDTAYDQRVAGIISGANGVNPGLSLRQEGLVEGGQNVALSGRVYVLADAAGGAIKPGDLLTTATTPGHAMKATDHTKAQGAVIGKAMSALKEGKGMVLVLVSLQ
jgi:hypothetical protein